MAIYDMTNEVAVDTSKDTVTIVKILETVPGGRTLDTTRTGISDLTVLKAGHVITRETSTNEYFALGLSGENYESLPAGHEYAGILIGSIPVAKPDAAILVRGTVNDSEALVPYAIPAGAKTALNLIRFAAD